MKFGYNPTMRDKSTMVEDRYGKTTGTSKGYTPPPKGKFKPKIGKDKVGLTYTQLLRGGMK